MNRNSRDRLRYAGSQRDSSLTQFDRLDIRQSCTRLGKRSSDTVDYVNRFFHKRLANHGVFSLLIQMLGGTPNLEGRCWQRLEASETPLGAASGSPPAQSD